MRCPHITEHKIEHELAIIAGAASSCGQCGLQNVRDVYPKHARSFAEQAQSLEQRLRLQPQQTVSGM